MAQFDNVPIIELMDSAITNVFETMLSIDLTKSVETTGGVGFEGQSVIGSVGFAGQTKGVVYVQFGEGFGRVVAGAMLGMEPADFGEAEVDDVVGELSNMIGGSIKSRLCDLGLNCSLSVPSVVRCSEVEVSPVELGDGILEECVYLNENHSVRLVVALIKGDQPD